MTTTDPLDLTRAVDALRAYQRGSAPSLTAASRPLDAELVADLLVDLLHLVDATRGRDDDDAERVLHMAAMNYHAERDGDDLAVATSVRGYSGLEGMQ